MNLLKSVLNRFRISENGQGRKEQGVFGRIMKNVSGQGLVEYGLILGLVSVVAIGTLGGVGDKINNTLSKVGNDLGIVGGEESPDDSEGVIPDPIPVTHTVTIEDHDGTIITTIDVVEGESVTVPDAPTREGYTFIGWSDSFENVQSDITITPIYEAKTYTITFVDGSDKNLGNATVEHGGSVNAPAVTNVPSNIDTSDMWNKPLNNITSDGEFRFMYTLISTPQELQAINSNYDTLSKKYLQVKDINMSSFRNFIPIGSIDSHFNGVYNGGGFAINNLTINRPSENYVGLFGRLYGGSLKNISLNGVNITGKDYIGGLVGAQAAGSTTINSYVTGNVKGERYVGGLVGNQNLSNVLCSYAKGNVSSSLMYGGGLVGYQYLSIVDNSYAISDVTGSSAIGGLVGANFVTSSDSISNSGWAKDKKPFNTGVGMGEQNLSTSNVKGYTTFEIETIIKTLIK